MASGLYGSLRGLCHSRWVVLVCSSWVETCTGLNVMYATFSPAIKSSLGYNQKQISRLGVAKDFGNAAEIIAGCLSKVMSPRGLLLLGGFQFLLSYGLLWLSVVTIIPAAPFWIVFVLIFIGANAQKYLDMAAVLSCLPSFSDSRGSVLGVLKAFKGLSGAIFSQLYTTFFAPLRSAALLMVAVGPALMSVTMSAVVRPVGKAHTEDKKFENRMYTVLFSICLLIAGYMVIVLFFQGDLPAGDYRLVLLFSGLLALIASPLLATVIMVSIGSHKASKEYNPHISSGLSTEPLLHHYPHGLRAFGDSTDEEHGRGGPEPLTDPLTNRPPGKEDELVVGKELTFCQALKTPHFWLLFFALYCGLGSGSTAIDNLAQMAESQGYDNTHTFVSIFSLSSYMGHLVGGYTSEILVRNSIPRPVSLIGAEGIMMLAQFLFAMAWPGSMYVASICLGFSYGSFSSINPAISSELFGLQSFGPIFGLLTLSAPASSTILAGLVAGTIYDREAAKQHSSECTGQVCFYLTCWIMVGVCAVGMALIGLLSWIVRDLYKKQGLVLKDLSEEKAQGLA